jgi:cytochrome c oxidase subunit 2
MPHFRAQMNCVPGMVTQFSFIPDMTTSEMRETEDMVAKVTRINQIRDKKNVQLVAEGKTPLDPYTFDFLLLCNKICGASHYNMQMKVVVDTPEEFKAWLKDKPTLAQAVKDANAAPADGEKPAVTNDSTTAKADTTVVAQVEMK